MGTRISVPVRSPACSTCPRQTGKCYFCSSVRSHYGRLGCCFSGGLSSRAGYQSNTRGGVVVYDP